jgi:class 3 adenylate cyclase
VLFRRGWADGAGQRVAALVASKIPGAELAGVSGMAAPHWAEVPDEIMQAVDAFLDGVGVVAAPSPATAPTPGLLQAILFTDVEESTLLTATLGDAAAREVMRTHEQLTREAVVAHGGTEVKAMGDGFMVAFPSASGGLDCAVALQQTFAQHNESADTPIRIRIGVNAGEPIAEDDDLFGTAVIVAARVAARANGGEILTTEGVRHLVAGKGYGFSDHGTAELKGFEEPMRLYAVAWE